MVDQAKIDAMASRLINEWHRGEIPLEVLKASLAQLGVEVAFDATEPEHEPELGG